MAARLRSAESMKLALLGREAGEVGVGGRGLHGPAEAPRAYR